MDTYTIKNVDTGAQIGFEIENAYILPKHIARILNGVPGVSEVNHLGTFRNDTDIRVTFQYNGSRFVVAEPFGDNSRYVVAPSDPAQHQDIDPIENAFVAYQPPFWRKSIGDILLLKPLFWLFRK